MESKILEHNGPYNAKKPVLIYQKETITGLQKRITGVAKIGKEFLNEGDIIASKYIVNNATSSLPYKLWEVKKVIERFTPPPVISL